MVSIEPTTIYTSAELAKLLDVQERELWALLNSGELRGVKIGRIWRVTGKSLLKYVNNTSNAVISQSTAQKKKAPNAPKAQLSSIERAENLELQLSSIEKAENKAQTAPKAHLYSIERAEKPKPHLDLQGLIDPSMSPRQQRLQAVQEAFNLAGNNAEAARLLNEWVASGGPTPERSNEWTTDRVRQTLLRIHGRK